MTATLGTQWNTMHSFFIHLTAKSTHHQDVVTILCVTEPDWSTAWVLFLLWVQQHIWKSRIEALYIQWERGHGATVPQFHKWG